MSEQEAEPSPKRRFKLPIGRQRLIELLVVVFGVMIALGLENLVEEIRLHGDARELEEALQEDLALAVAQSFERQVIAPCLRQRLALLTKRVSTPNGATTPSIDASPGGMDFVLPPVYRAPTRLWPTSTFDRAIGSEAFKRIPRERASAYAMNFAHIATMRDDNNAEFYAATGLAPLAWPQPDLDPEVRADLLKTLSTLDRHNTLAVLSGEQLIRSVLTMPGGDRIGAEVLEDVDGLEEFVAQRRRTYGDCVDAGAADRLLELTRG